MNPRNDKAPPKEEKKDFSTAILDRKKAPNRLIVINLTIAAINSHNRLMMR